MKLYRYELFCDDEPQDVGILVGLDDLGFSCETQEALMKPFDTELEIPDLPSMRNSVSFFTEAGNETFRDAIQALVKAYEDSLFDVQLAELELPQAFAKDIIYQDENQVCLPRFLYLTVLSHLVKRTDISHDQFSPSSFKTVNPYIIGPIYHVGTMDISKKTNHSQEGNGLSISNCPDAWRTINKGFTHGDCFRLEKADMRLLDFYSLTCEETQTIEDWAIQEGFVTRGTVYKVLSSDEEGRECFSLYESFDAAMEEAYDDMEFVEPIDSLLPTQKLLDYSMVRVELLDIPSIITELYAEHVLDYDGVYWDEELDVYSYSAPRGVIFNSKVSTFEAVNLTKALSETKCLDAIISSAEQKKAEMSEPHSVEPVLSY